MSALQIHAALAVCCTLLGLAGAGEKRPAPEFGVRGRVEKIAPPPSEGRKKDILGYVTVVGKKEADTETDQAVVIVTKSTRIVRRTSPKRLAFSDLKVGMRIQAKFQPGPRILIYPPRVAATEIVILGGPAVPAGKSSPPAR